MKGNQLALITYLLRAKLAGMLGQARMGCLPLVLQLCNNRILISMISCCQEVPQES